MLEGVKQANSAYDEAMKVAVHAQALQPGAVRVDHHDPAKLVIG